MFCREHICNKTIFSQPVEGFLPKKIKGLQAENLTTQWIQVAGKTQIRLVLKSSPIFKKLLNSNIIW